ncbi:MAG TPA: Jag N-terminal domain-containing protein [Actinomycetota bacterium]|jgi:spoIIIJ-associated protein|nr:Jag N-terminal domain-containing protein [Actinomycetota bacterium]
MPWITKEGRTVEEAKDAAVTAAGLPVDDLEVEVVSEGAKGLFGLGGEPAVVRVRAKDEATDVRHAFRDDITPDATVAAEPVSAPVESPVTESADEAPLEDAADKLSLSEQQEQAAALGAEIVRGIIDKMGLEGDINTRVAGGTVYVEVFGEEMGILIGRGGTTLEALQELVRAGVQRRLKTRQALVVDVEAYWERRRTTRRRNGDERRRDGNRRPRGERRGGGNR